MKKSRGAGRKGIAKSLSQFIATPRVDGVLRRSSPTMRIKFPKRPTLRTSLLIRMTQTATGTATKGTAETNAMKEIINTVEMRGTIMIEMANPTIEGDPITEAMTEVEDIEGTIEASEITTEMAKTATATEAEATIEEMMTETTFGKTTLIEVTVETATRETTETGMGETTITEMRETTTEAMTEMTVATIAEIAALIGEIAALIAEIVAMIG